MRKGVVSISALVAALTLSVAGMAQGPASVPAPEGWKQCPRCQNNKDRADSKVKYRLKATRLIRVTCQAYGVTAVSHQLSGILLR